jgi:hypothetical protein
MYLLSLKATSGGKTVEKVNSNSIRSIVRLPQYNFTAQ